MRYMYRGVGVTRPGGRNPETYCGGLSGAGEINCYGWNPRLPAGNLWLSGYDAST